MKINCILPLFVGSFIFVFANIDSGLAQTQKPLVIANLLNALAPDNTQENLPIFTDSRFAPGTACSISYSDKNNQLKISLLPIQADNDESVNSLRKLKFSSDWSIGNWITNRSFPNFCAGSSAHSSTDSVSLTVKDSYGELPLNFVASKHEIVMELNSREFWRDLFNASEPLFRSLGGPAEGWPNFFLSKNMHFSDKSLLWMNEINRRGGLRFEFDAKLNDAHVVTDNLPPPKNQNVPPGAQLNYNPKKHATQFRIAIGVQYLLTAAEKNKYHCSGKDALTPNPLCKNNGRYFHYMITIFDERFNYLSQLNSATGRPSFMEDFGTNSMMYGESLQNLFSLKQTKQWFDSGENPYKIVNQRFKIDTNLAPLISRAILLTEKQQMVDYKTKLIDGQQKIPAIPQRIGNETDNEYINHFAISSVNLGYEVNGISDISMSIYNFTLETER